MLYFTYMIITRYGLSKITNINESVFSQMWKRHQSGKDFYGFFTDDGKVDIESPSFIQKYNLKIIPEELQKLKDKLNKKVPVKKIEKIVKTKIKNKKIDPPPTNLEEPDKPKTELQILSEKSAIAKFKKDIFAADKAELDLKKSRAQLAELDSIGQTCITFCVALAQSLLDQPRSWIDEVTSGIKAGKSKTELTDIARKPEMASIAETKELILKEIAKYKREVKSDNK